MSDSTQGQAAPQAAQEDATQGVTIEAVTELVNRAITARNKAFETKFEKNFADLRGGFESTLQSAFAKYAEEAAAKSDPKAAAKDEESPAFKGLKKQLEQLQSEREKERITAEGERAKARDASLRTRLSEELSKHGIDPTRARHAVGFLVDTDKRIRFDDAGESIVFRDSDNQEIDLQTGLKTWVKSDEAKFYMPPRGTTGSGERAAGFNQRTPAGTDARSELAAKFASALTNL